MPAKKDKTQEKASEKEKTEKTTTEKPEKEKSEKKTATKKKTHADKALAIPKRMKVTGDKRERKTIQRYTEVPEVSHQPTEIVIRKGKGKKFEDCPNVLSQINKRPRSDDTLRLVHNLFIGRVNKKVQVKSNLKQFSGVVYDDDKDKERLEAKLARQKIRDLRELARFFAIDDQGEREDLVENIIKYVEKPFPSDKEPSSPKKATKKSSSSSKSSSKKSSSSSKSSKKSGEKKRRKKDPNAPKRPLSSYMFFCQDHREEVKGKLGKDQNITDMAKKLGKMWSKLGDDDKKKYEKKAAKAKEVYEKEKKKYEKSKEKSKSSDSE